MSEDWDEPGTSAPAQPSSFGFGDAGALRGMGRGMMNDAEPRALRGATMNGGFGSDQPGFDSKFDNNNSSSRGGFGGGFGDGNSGGGFGSGFDGGFGRSSGFAGGFGSSGGFGSDSSRRGRGGGRGGRGGGSGGSRACFKCGEEGHMSRDCPNPGSSGGGGGGGSRACFKCGEDGHISRDCPKGGGGSRACFKCGEDGHISRDCPNPGSGDRGGRSSRGGFSGRGRSDEPRGGGFGERNGFGETSGVRDGFGGASVGDGFGSGDTGSDGFGGGQRGRGGSRGGRGGFGQRDGFGSDTSGGFGQENRDGFGGGFGQDNNRDGFGGGFGQDNKRDGFSGGFGSSGFGGERSDDGFGGDKKSSSGCHKCGEQGHFARECTKEPADGDKKRVPMYIPPPMPEDEEHIFETIQKGINFDKYDQISVECTGQDALMERDTIRSFAGADLDDVFQANVEKAHYDKPTPIQKWAIPIIMRGRDLMACAQTGSGKTAAFLLPVLTEMRRAGLSGSAFSSIQEPQAIVVGPTRELVVQIHHEARKFSYGTMIRSVVVYGGVSTRYQINELQKGAHIVIGTPGRLMDVIEKRIISLAKVRYLIFDEADRMLDMGFLPSMRKLVGETDMPGKGDRQTLMFSATFPEEVQRLAQEILGDKYLFLVVGRVGGANTDIVQTIYNVDSQGKRDKVLSILNESTGRTLVFVEQKRQADFLASYLSQMELPTTSIHGDREQREREEALSDFKSGRARVLVATSVAARGLDISGVEHVINYDMPQSIEDYVHRIGRTGRCGNIGRATSFFDPSSDSQLARPLVKVLVDAQQEIPDWLEEMSTGTVGVGGFTGAAGRFEAKDSRRGNFGGRSGGNFESAPSFSTPAGGDDDDCWD